MNSLLRLPWAARRHPAATLCAIAIVLAGCSKNDATAPGALGTKLVFTVQPANSIVDSSMTVAPVVAIEDADGNLASGASNSVQLTISANPGNGSFIGTTSVVAVGGVASFPHISINTPGSGYTITATSGTLTPATSAPFNMSYQTNGQFTSINVGASSSCGIAKNGSAYCWGSGTFGQLGNGITTPSTTPSKVSGGLSFTSVTPGSLQYYSCGLATGGAAYCWGYNDYGQLGTGNQSNSSVPLAVTGGLSFTKLSAGLDGHACGIANGGAVWCWGYNNFGQIGPTQSAFSTVPVALPGGLTFTAISAGQNGTTCGLVAGGAAYCWGFNGDGELGNGSTANSSTPVAVSGGHVFSSISTGYSSACGLANGGAVFCWGDNHFGGLGNGSSVASNVPVLVTGGLSFVSVSVGDAFACGLSATGVAYCWGYNGNGQLGTGSINANSVPAAVLGSLQFASISAGYSSACAVTSGGAGYCWGDNAFGELGIASTFQSLTPALVATPP